MHASSNLNFKTYYHNMYESTFVRSTFVRKYNVVLPEVQRTVTVYNCTCTALHTTYTHVLYGNTEVRNEVRKYFRKYVSKVRKYNYTCTRTCTRVALSISKILNFRYTLLASPRERGRRRQSEMNCAKHRTASIDAKKTGDKCSYAATTRC